MKRLCAVILFCGLLLTGCAGSGRSPVTFAENPESVPEIFASNPCECIAGLDWGMDEGAALSALDWSEEDWTQLEEDENIRRYARETLDYQGSPITMTLAFSEVQFPFLPEGTLIDAGLTEIGLYPTTAEQGKAIKSALDERYQHLQGQETGWKMGLLEDKHPNWATLLSIWNDSYFILHGKEAESGQWDYYRCAALATVHLGSFPAMEPYAGVFLFSGEACAHLNHMDEIAAEYDAIRRR